MFASSRYPPDQAAADAFVAEMRHGTLVACAPGGHPQVSILPFVRGGGFIELHCVQADPTLDAVRANPLVTFFVSDFLAWSPHDWVNPVDAGVATLHFRAVAFECQAEDVSTDPELRERNHPGDARAADVIEQYLPASPGGPSGGAGRGGE